MLSEFYLHLEFAGPYHIDRKQGGKVRVGVVQLKRAQDKRDMRAFDAINKGSAFGKGW